MMIAKKSFLTTADRKYTILSILFCHGNLLMNDNNGGKSESTI